MKHGSAALAGVALLAAAGGFAAGWTSRGAPEAVAPTPPPASVRSTDPPSPASPELEALPTTSPPEAAAEPPRAMAPEPVPTSRRRADVESPAPDPSPALRSQEELLASAGFSSGAVQDLRQRTERLEKARDYLSDESQREELAASVELSRAQRKEIGDEAYSYMLWSAGIPNRIVVNEVLSDSNASRLGLQRGDVVLSYNGQRLFEIGELRLMVQEPSGRGRGIEILRNDEVVELTAPPGLLGISVTGSFDPPREDIEARRRARSRRNVQVAPPDPSDR